MMSDTPRTDAQFNDEYCYGGYVSTEFAQQLERELVEAQAEIVRLTKRKDQCSNGWDGALASVQRLERELADAKRNYMDLIISVENIAQKCAAAIRKGE